MCVSANHGRSDSDPNIFIRFCVCVCVSDCVGCACVKVCVGVCVGVWVGVHVCVCESWQIRFGPQHFHSFSSKTKGFHTHDHSSAVPQLIEKTVVTVSRLLIGP